MTATSGGRCTGCGYDLAGLDDASWCPECGSPVRRSRRGELLEFADPGVLRGVRAGLWVLLAMSVAGVVASLVSTIAGSPPLAGRSPEWLWTYVLSPAWLVLSLAEAVGWWLVTVEDAADEGRIGALRVSVRVAAVAAVVTSGMSVLWMAVLPPASPVFLVSPWIDRSADMTLFILGVHYLRRLAERSSPAGPVGMVTLLLGSGVFVRLTGWARSGWYLMTRYGMTRTPEFFNMLAWAGVATGLAGVAMGVLQCVVLFTLIGRVNAALGARRTG
jgi:hypothetical protein